MKNMGQGRTEEEEERKKEEYDRIRCLEYFMVVSDKGDFPFIIQLSRDIVHLAC